MPTKLLNILLIFFLLIAHSGIAQPRFKYSNAISVVSDHPLKMPWAGGLNSPQVSNFDFNGDQQADLFIYDKNNQQAKAFLWQDDQYIPCPECLLDFPEALNGWVLLRDYNGDGLPDIFTKQQFGISVYENIGQGDQWEFQLVADPLASTAPSGREQNLQCSSTDIPAIQDIDGDGDLDILVYNFAMGGFVRSHINRSMENDGTMGLNFALDNLAWGEFEECDCQHYAFENEGCGASNYRIEHVGGKSLTLLDLNDDGLLDLLAGHEQCPELYFLPNTGTAANALFRSFEAPYQQVSYPYFPVAYTVATEGRTSPSLLVGSNYNENDNFGVDFKNTLWKLDLVDGEYQLKTNNYLQGEMIDVGAYASAITIDLNDDQKNDLLVAGQGKMVDGKSYFDLQYFENNGNNQQASLTQKPTTMLNTDQLDGAFPKLQSFDLNQDGKADILLSMANPDLRFRTLYVALATENGFTAFQPLSNNLSSFTQLRFHDQIHFFSKEGKTFAIMARKEGRLELWAPEISDHRIDFSLITDRYLSIEDNYTQANPSVFYVNDPQGDYLLKTDFSQQLTVITDLDTEPTFTTNTWQLTDSDTPKSFRLGDENNINIGFFTPNSPHVLVGQKSGGILLLENEEPSSVVSWSTTAYPNPLKAGQQLTVKSSLNSEVAIFNMLGQRIGVPIKLQANESQKIPFPRKQGILLLQFKSSQGIRTHKIVIE